MNLLITGSRGFLGSSLADSKKMKNHTVHRLSSDRFDLSDGNIIPELSAWLNDKHIDICFHFASQTPFHTHPEAIDYTKDAMIAKNISTLCNSLDIKTLVNASGWVVYSANSNIPITEDAPLDPPTDYGKSKLSVENSLKSSLTTTILINLRLASIYGPGQRSNGLIPNLIRSALETGDMSINTRGVKRDYLFVEDFVDVCHRILETPVDASLDLNIGSGQSQSVILVAETIRNILKRDYNQEIGLIEKAPMKEQIPFDNRLDITRAQQIVHYHPMTSFENGLTCTIQSIKNL